MYKRQDERADGDDQIVLVAGGHQLVQGSSDHTLGAVAAVVGHHAQLVAAGLELVLEDEQVFACLLYTSTKVKSRE